jgi:hypothetical protein|tara:strand:- start:1259 stop:1882 length:624 start_codon:yes stop_codon:yes gene_type:complete
MTDLFNLSTDLVQHEIYQYLKPQADLLFNQSYFEDSVMDFTQYERILYENNTYNMDEEVESWFMTPLIFTSIYHNYFPNDGIFDIFSPSDDLREHIATDTMNLMLETRPSSFCDEECKKWRNEQNNRFHCLKGTPIDYFYTDNVLGEHEHIGYHHDFNWIHTESQDNITYTCLFYTDMIDILREKMENYDNHQRIYEFYREIVNNYQ